MNINKKSLKKTLDDAIAKSREHPNKTYYVWDVKGKPTAMCSETNVAKSFTYCFTDNIYLFATVKNEAVSYTRSNGAGPKPTVV